MRTGALEKGLAHRSVGHPSRPAVCDLSTFTHCKRDCARARALTPVNSRQSIALPSLRHNCLSEFVEAIHSLRMYMRRVVELDFFNTPSFRHFNSFFSRNAHFPAALTHQWQKRTPQRRSCRASFRVNRRSQCQSTRQCLTSVLSIIFSCLTHSNRRYSRRVCCSLSDSLPIRAFSLQQVNSPQPQSFQHR